MNSSSTYSSFFPPASISPIEITYSDAQDLVNMGIVKFGTQYLITDANGTDLGVLVVGMQDGKFFSLQGSGGFLNPDYQAVGDYSGVRDVTGNSAGPQRGVWSASGEGSYANSDIVIWNGLHYQVIELDPQGTDPAINTQMYQVLPKSAPNVGYIEEWDDIEYEFTNNWIQSRKDKRGNKVACDANTAQNQLNGEAFSQFQWGNNNVLSNLVQSSEFHVLNNTGTLVNNIISNLSNVKAELNDVSALEACNIISSNSNVDFSSITTSYVGKTLSPHLSTFNADVSQIGASIACGDYIGMINITSSDGTPIEGFDNQPTFKRKIIYTGIESPALVFVNTGNLKFPIPSTGTTLSSNGLDFIEFIWDSTQNFHIQTASEQY